MEEPEREHGPEVEREARRLLGEEAPVRAVADEEVGAEQPAWRAAPVPVLVGRRGRG